MQGLDSGGVMHLQRGRGEKREEVAVGRGELYFIFHFIKKQGLHHYITYISINRYLLLM